MPRLDGTGPNGQGPMTGRRMGNCNVNNNVNANLGDTGNQPAPVAGFGGAGFCDGSRKRIRGNSGGFGGGFGGGGRGFGRGGGRGGGRGRGF